MKPDRLFQPQTLQTKRSREGRRLGTGPSEACSCSCQHFRRREIHQEPGESSVVGSQTTCAHVSSDTDAAPHFAAAAALAADGPGTSETALLQ